MEGPWLHSSLQGQLNLEGFANGCRASASWVCPSHFGVQLRLTAAMRLGQKVPLLCHVSAITVGMHGSAACLREYVLPAGLVMPIEMLVSNGTLKLVSLLLSAQYLGYRGLWHDINFDGGLHLTFWPAILFDCILHPALLP